MFHSKTPISLEELASYAPSALATEKRKRMCESMKTNKTQTGIRPRAMRSHEAKQQLILRLQMLHAQRILENMTVPKNKYINLARLPNVFPAGVTKEN